MKKPLIALGIAMLLATGAYAQTQRLNRTNKRTHDRSDATNPGTATDQKDKTRPDRMNHENDVDRNNTNNNTNTNTGADTTNTRTNDTKKRN